MTLRRWLATAALTAGVAGSNTGPASAAESAPAGKPVYAFSTLKPMTAEAARARVEAWLKSIDKLDAAAVKKIWDKEERSVLDRVADSIALGNTEAEALLANARKPDAPAPTDAPGLFKDAKLDPFVRTNLALAFAKGLSAKRVYEEALDALAAVPPEHAVEPAAFFFYKAVAEHALTKKDLATRSIVRLLDDVADAPDRYKMVATLMFFEMQAWSADPKDLSNIEKLMDNSGRRLDLARGGEKTQDIQKKIVFRLDEIIKEAENKQKQQGQGGGGPPNGGNCPGGGTPGSSPGNTTNPSAPAGDSVLMGGAGKGESVDKKLRSLADNWGSLPPDQRAQAIMDVNRDLPPKYKPMIEEYFKSLNRVHGVTTP